MRAIAALRAELSTGHPVTGTYSADAEIAAAQINTADITMTKPEARLTDLAIVNSLGLSRGHEVLTALESRSNNDPLSKRVLGFLKRGGGIDVAHRDASGFIGSLVSASVITQQEAEQIAANGKVSVSRAAQLRATGVFDVDRVKPGHILEARRIGG